MKITQTILELNGMTFHARHGVLAQEQVVGALFTVDLSLSANLAQAVETDRLSATLNYATVYEVVREEMEKPSQLIEHVAGRIAGRLLNEFSALKTVGIRVCKQHPPIAGAECKEACISLTCTRS